MKTRPRSTGLLIGLSIVAAALVAALLALGVWQVHRLAWKRDLIHKVETRVHARPITAPRTAGGDDAYVRVTASGKFLHDRATLVQALTARGAGYWVLTPLVTDRGFTLLVNRGFVPGEARQAYGRPDGTVRVTGLLRLSEPRGGFLRANDPTADRWHSRDVEAIGKARRVPAPLANYFVDAEAGPAKDARPIGGLTVIDFPNNHLSYAITWFALAAMVAGGYILLMRHEWKERRA